MSRAHRHFLPGHVWHITHRCHNQEFLLKFARDRDCWRYWLYQARRRYGLSVLNYIVTSNHIHLLVSDQGKAEISKSLQLIAGRTAQAYNQRKQRRGAYWEDRYHATAIESGEHLARCMVYIDLNMVRAGIVSHPMQWQWSGGNEIQQPRRRYRVLDHKALCALFEVQSEKDFQMMHKSWIEAAISSAQFGYDPAWSNSLAVGSADYIRRIQGALGILYRNRDCVELDGKHVLKETAEAYRLDYRA